MGKTIQCPASELGDYINDQFGNPTDLHSGLHKGFTIGKRGKKMYWYFLWNANSEYVAIFTASNPMERAYIKYDQLITIHFK